MAGIALKKEVDTEEAIKKDEKSISEIPNAEKIIKYWSSKHLLVLMNHFSALQ